MKPFVKYLLINVEAFMMLLTFMAGMILAANNSFFLGILMLIAPVLYGEFVGFSKHIEFAEIYTRALNIKLYKKLQSE